MPLSRPWAYAVPRLLRERNLKGIDLVEYGGLKRQGTVSAVLNSPKTPKLATLLNIARAIEQADRLVNKQPHPAPVETWEFFVSDEQAGMLRSHAAHRAELVKPPAKSEEQVMSEKIRKFLEWDAAQSQPAEKRTLRPAKKR